MFSNRFNTKNDPLLEAVQNAMQDGAIRRQAEAYVNEQFGVYSRKAVVREHLADYDAALEEAYADLKEGYKDLAKKSLQAMADKAGTGAFFSGGRPKSMLTTNELAKSALKDMAAKAGESPYKKKKNVKEETKLAKKDYDKDGKIESPKDEVWGSRLRAAKMAGKMEEGRMPASVIKHKQKLAGMTDAEKKAKFAGKSEEELKSMARRHGYGKDSSEYSKHVTKKVEEGNMMDPNDPSVQGGSDVTSTPAKHVRAPNMKPLNDPRDSSYQGGGDVTSGGKPASIREAQIDEISADTAHFASYVADRKAKDARDAQKGTDSVIKKRVAGHKESKYMKQSRKFREYGEKKDQMDEAAYSTKAARSGKDIGKPGKQFSNIAAKAAAKYGSEERGKKVAGAILKRIRAKHMKEDQSF
jgi:hypothetical protein